MSFIPNVAYFATRVFAEPQALDLRSIDRLFPSAKSGSRARLAGTSRLSRGWRSKSLQSSNAASARGRVHSRSGKLLKAAPAHARKLDLAGCQEPRGR